MKKCPTCKSVYTDDTLAFCLSDGTPLDPAYDSEQTLQIPSPITTDPSFSTHTSNLNKPQKNIETEVFNRPDDTFELKKGANPIWIYSTIALLFFVIGGAVFAFIFGERLFNEKSANQSSPSPQILSNSTPNPMVNSSPMTTKIIETKNPVKTPPQSTPTPELTPDTATYRVVGVAASDVLYIRPAAGNLKSSVGSIPPDGVGIVITGKGVKAGKSVWFPINYKGTKGWVTGKFIAKE